MRRTQNSDIITALIARHQTPKKKIELRRLLDDADYVALYHTREAQAGGLHHCRRLFVFVVPPFV